jgi:hypothetical protein
MYQPNPMSKTLVFTLAPCDGVVVAGGYSLPLPPGMAPGLLRCDQTLRPAASLGIINFDLYRGDLQE